MEHTKSFLRRQYLEKRLALSIEEVDTASLAIANRCLELPMWEKEIFHLFLSITQKNEVVTNPLLTLLQGRDKSIVVPKILPEGNLEHILLQDATKIKLNAWGVPEPLSGILIPPEKIEVVFVPLLVFDTQGNRVGYGKGFYDRFLAACSPQVIKVGLSFFEPVERIADVDAFDIPLTACVTPLRSYLFSPEV
ncbi:5-formyltetrahydrofolate cyclo-ligase [Flavobacteriaceae bacterium]|nr:5-formyltetrahydrofolate cyclo-ligase [Flavobacteriaceae bacterium]MDA7712249.1 5-formyltetrahydrofolate cyclo-ligase [Flavobacteriaceae bacterium]MDA8900236.1 5-formyltetrahydrofolate cyclo-ligase [Flavobacteriaceae bacterium]MDA8992997.1 5-formyltetrahydrofolate cyclo-ligase [Flavobacteriaceae bacterium]